MKKRKPITSDIDMVKDFVDDKTHAKSLLNSEYGITATVHAKSLLNSEYGITATVHAKSLLNSAYGITAERETAENDTAYKMSDIQFEAFKCQLKRLAPCDFPPAIVLHQASEDMTDRQKKEYSQILLNNGLAIYHNGKIVTAKGGFHLYTPAPKEPKTDHTYEIKVFRDGVFSFSNEFSLESSAYNAFKKIEICAIECPNPCFKVILLFKDGKVVKISIIHFGEKLV